MCTREKYIIWNKSSRNERRKKRLTKKNVKRKEYFFLSLVFEWSWENKAFLCFWQKCLTRTPRVSYQNRLYIDICNTFNFRILRLVALLYFQLLSKIYITIAEKVPSTETAFEEYPSSIIIQRGTFPTLLLWRFNLPTQKQLPRLVSVIYDG